MDNFIITRAQVQDKLKELTGSIKDYSIVKEEMKNWLVDQNVSNFEMQQIINDLTSYSEYLSLMN